jgi:hypothetical protein
MNNLINSLKGYKTYLVAAVAIILTGLLGTGHITQDQYNLIMGILAPLGVMALRAGIKNSVSGTDAQVTPPTEVTPQV